MQDTEKAPPVLDLQRIKDSSVFAEWLGYWPRGIHACAKTIDGHVKVFTVDVKGKKRRIFDPDHVLRAFQKRIKTKMLDRAPVSDCVHGFVTGRGCVTNARSHLNFIRSMPVGTEPGLVVVDIKNFFPSITTPRVHALMAKTFLMQQKPAWLVTSLCTFMGHLAQGLPNSPIISNMTAWRIDRRMDALAKKLGMNYTRYADDMYMSGTVIGDGEWVMNTMKSIVTDEGFVPNEEKCGVFRKRLKVTGIVVDYENNELKLPRRYRQKVSYLVRHYGEYKPEQQARIRGMVAWSLDAHPAFGRKMKSMIDEFDLKGRG